jgi:hypothetical protein
MREWNLVRALLILGLSAFCESGCSWEDRGPLLVSDAQTSGGTLVWSADGTEIAYVGHETGTQISTVQMLRVADGAVRQLDVPAYPATPLVRASDGSALYFIAADDRLRDALTGTTIATRRASGLGAIGTSFDANSVLYWDPGPSSTSPGSAVLLDRHGQTSRSIAFCGFAWFAFSPAADVAVCAAPSTTVIPWEVQSFTLIDVATAVAGRNLPTSVAPQALHWGSGALQVAGPLLSDAGALAVNDLLSGTTRVVFHLPPPSSSAINTKDFPDKSSLTQATFSADGRKLAFWQAECVGRNYYEPEYCANARGEVVVLDLVTGARQVLAKGEATADGGGGAGPLAFSDDGGRLAYQIGTEIHLRPTR